MISPNLEQNLERNLFRRSMYKQLLDAACSNSSRRSVATRATVYPICLFASNINPFFSVTVAIRTIRSMPKVGVMPRVAKASVTIRSNMESAAPFLTAGSGPAPVGLLMAMPMRGRSIESPIPSINPASNNASTMRVLLSG